MVLLRFAPAGFWLQLSRSDLLAEYLEVWVELQVASLTATVC
jgi:hypothetical protein